MLLLGNDVLGNLNKQATSQKSLGLAFWRIVIAAGIVVIIMGAINLFAVSIPPSLNNKASLLTCTRATSSVIPRSASQHDKSALTELWLSTKSTSKASRRSKLSNLAGETLYHPTTRAQQPPSRRLHSHRDRDPPSHHPSTTSRPPFTVTKTSSRQRRRLRYRILHIIRQCIRTGYKRERSTWQYLGETASCIAHESFAAAKIFVQEKRNDILMIQRSNYCIREPVPFLYLP